MQAVAPSLDGQLFGILFENGPEATFSIHRETRTLLSANIRLGDMVGRSCEALIGTSADALFGTDERVDNWVDQLLSRPGLHEDVSLIGLDGYRIYVAVTAAHIDHPEFGPLVAGVARDTTERRILERELIAKHSALYAAHADLAQRNRELVALGAKFAQAARRANIGEFSAGIAHSMNNPMAALASALRQIMRRIESHGDAELVASVDKFHRRYNHALARLQTIVDAVKRSHRSGKLDGEPKQLVLADELDIAVTLFEARLDKIAVVREFDADTRAWASPDAFHHVVSNLIDNAIRAMADGGQLTLAVRRADDHTVLTIADTGCGIPESIASKLFEPFVSATSEGSGLGLSMSQRLAREWGGDIAVVPTPRGARFDITLPVEESPCPRSES